MVRSSPHRRLLYEVALATGLRAGELRALESRHLDVLHSRIILESRWTKNRREGYQPVPRWLMDELVTAGEERQAAKFHAGVENGWKRKRKLPVDSLLYVPEHTAREMQKDCATAWIPAKGHGWRVDFHALRVTFITLVVESGADIKTAQTLARHSTPQVTLNVYAKMRPERLVDTTDRGGESILGHTAIAEPALAAKEG